MSLEVDGEPAEQCPVCEVVQGVKYDAADPTIWRFEGHTRPYWHKNKWVYGIGCLGQRKTLDDARKVKRKLDALGKQFPDEE